MKLNNFIMIHKGLTGFFVLFLISVYKQWDNPTAWIYLGLHGSYGILWLLKSFFFPDPQWQRKTNLMYGVLVGWGSLTTYWIAPWLICSDSVQSPMWLISITIILFVFGVFFHFTADMQKFTALQYLPGQLVKDGVWSISRNPNYLGEFLIYFSLSILSMHWQPLAILFLWIIVYWYPNMIRKDKSLERYPEFKEYAKRTKRFIPYVL